MRIAMAATAGTLEPRDASVSVEPAEPREGLVVVVEGAEVRLASRVRAIVEAVLAELGVVAARVTVRDRNASDRTLRARVMAACLRAAGRESSDKLPWEYLR